MEKEEELYNIEKKRNKLNLELRTILAIIEMVDGNNVEYNNYIENSLSEDMFLEQQITLTNEIKTRLVDILKI